jgi:hypothetical protein
LTDLELAIRSSWDALTCDPAEPEPWSADNPSRGQCVATTAVLHDYLGGDMLIAEVYVDGEQQGHHAWNRLAGGAEIDLTSAQFRPEESVGEPRVVARPSERPMRIQAQYELLRDRVRQRLSGGFTSAFATEQVSPPRVDPRTAT